MPSRQAIFPIVISSIFSARKEYVIFVAKKDVAGWNDGKIVSFCHENNVKDRAITILRSVQKAKHLLRVKSERRLPFYAIVTLLCLNFVCPANKDINIGSITP